LAAVATASGGRPAGSGHGRQAVLRDEILTPEDFMKKINKVSARDISRAARNIFANKGLNLAVIGPFRDGDKFEKILRI